MYKYNKINVYKVSKTFVNHTFGNYFTHKSDTVYQNI